MLDHIIQTLMGCIGTLGFSILFNIRGKKIGLLVLGGGLGWATYLVCSELGAGPFPALLYSTCVVAIFSEVLARVIKAPVIILLVPMLVPLIPGGGLYHTMSHLVSGEYDAFVQRAQQLLEEAGGIALGILLTATVTSLITGLYRHFRSPSRT